MKSLTRFETWCHRITEIAGIQKRTVIVLVAVVAISTTAPATSQTRVVLGDCVFQEGLEATQSAAIGGAVVGALIKNTLGRLGAALRKAGEEDVDVVIGRNAVELLPGHVPPCLVVAKGNWAPSETRKFPDNPDLLLEFVIVVSKNGSAVRLSPSYFEYRRMIEDKMPSRGTVKRGIAVEVAVHAPGTAPDSDTAVGASVAIGMMETGYRYNLFNGDRALLNDPDNWLEGVLPVEHSSPWFPTFSPAAEKATNPDSTQSQPLSQIVPKNVTVTFAETRKSREFLLLLADVFDETKDELQAAAELELTKSKQQEAELAAAKASNESMIDFVTKLAAAESAIANYCATDPADAGALSTAAGAANIAQRSTNLAATVVQQPIPYTGFVGVPAVPPEESGFCTKP